MLTEPIPYETSGLSPLHIAAELGTLEIFAADIAQPEWMLVQDKEGKTPLHYAVASGKLPEIPTHLLTNAALQAHDHQGLSVFEAIKRSAQLDVLPEKLRYLDEQTLRSAIREKMEHSLDEASKLFRKYGTQILSDQEFNQILIQFVQDWAKNHANLELDEEQADAVAAQEKNILVTARAGSGKTRTLVARALFQIRVRKCNPDKILILAFNRKAVGQIRERLGKALKEGEMPHVFTFHALAHRIVKPADELIYDAGETKEGKVLSGTVQRLIDAQMRSGPLENALRELMEARWSTDLERILRLGFNLSEEQFLKHRGSWSQRTLDDRPVKSDAHKHVGNSLLRLRIGYSYQRTIHRFSGKSYAPDFYHYDKESNRRVVIEILCEKSPCDDPARSAFWNSDASSEVDLIQIREEECYDPIVTMERVRSELGMCGIDASPMSDNDLWSLLRDDVIRDFTKAGVGFISRCQKELVSPEKLKEMLPMIDPDLWIEEQIGGSSIRRINIDGLKVRFWRLCSEIYERYQQALIDYKKIDFDQLMLHASELIRKGACTLRSGAGYCNLSEIQHILIDEFQDFSPLFNLLREAIITQAPGASFFCVGDDWQAINKFAGSDLRYFERFGDYFHSFSSKLISRNYRSGRKIVEIGNQVMDGHGAPSIPNNNESGRTWRIETSQCRKLNEAETLVCHELGIDAVIILRLACYCTSRGQQIAVLSRNRSVPTPDRMLDVEAFQRALRNFLPEKQRNLVKVSTTHGFKGEEADVVVILDPEGYPLIHPDNIFATIFGDTFESVLKDEQRLFYVGVTRPKKSLFLLSYPERYEGNGKPYQICFLNNRYPETFDIEQIPANLTLGKRVCIKITNPSEPSERGGTYLIKDRLGKSGYKWNPEGKNWWLYLDEGSIRSPFECIRYLMSQPWCKDAERISATISWEDQSYKFTINQGEVLQESTSSFQGVDAPDCPGSITNTSVQPTADLLAPEVGLYLSDVVGTKHHNLERAFSLERGERVNLVTDRANLHDPNAIKVVTLDGAHVGHLPRKIAAHLARALDDGDGVWPAKIASIWKQAPPHAHVSIGVCFHLPRGVTLPRSEAWEPNFNNNPFWSGTEPSIDSRSDGGMPQSPATAAPARERSPEGSHDITPTNRLGNLTLAQEGELDGLFDQRLAPLIAELYLSGATSWPIIGCEGRSGDVSDGTELEVGWPDAKIGLAKPGDQTASFLRRGWTVLDAATVTAEDITTAFRNALDC